MTLTTDDIDRAIAAAKTNAISPVNGFYYMTVSPWVQAMIVMVVAKAAWKEQHREARMKRRRELGTELQWTNR